MSVFEAIGISLIVGVIIYILMVVIMEWYFFGG